MFNIYLSGVGGQGIGLLSEILIRACDYAGYKVYGVDTHGLAQRGGVVESHLKIGEDIYSPLIKKNDADLIISLERTEALRGLINYSKKDSNLIFYDANWQPLFVRMGKDTEVSLDLLSNECKKRNVSYYRIFLDTLNDPKMQNIVVVANIAKKSLIPKVEIDHYENAIKDLLSGVNLERNLKLFSEMFI